MTPDIAGKGHSFMGAMAYYLHDKRQEADAAHPTSSDRVAWTDSRNLAGVGPHTATRTMIDHAQRADELKAAAGIRNTGRKSKAHVYAFSLSWRHDEVEGLDRAEMIRATDAALKFLGADHLQAVIIAHQDREHPHVHVVLNRVEADGRMWNPSFDKDGFSQWANRYERDNGKIVTPKRDEKWRKIEAGHQTNPDPEKRRRYTEDRKRQQSAASEKRPPSRGQMLKELADAQKAQHRQEWSDWGAQAKRGRKAIYADADARRKLALASFKESTRGDWAQHFRAERDRARTFEARERSISGVLKNALEAAKRQFREQPQGGRGMLALTFANVLDSQARRQTFAQDEARTKAQFTVEMKMRRDAHLVALEIEKRRAFIELSARINKSKADMIERQSIERSKMREAWRQFYASKESLAPGQTYRTRKPQPLPVKDHPMKDQFEKAGLAEANLSAGRHVPNEDVRLSTPAPAPTPTGIVDPPHSEIRPVPIVEKAAAIESEWTPSAMRDWSQPIDAPTAQPQQQTEQPPARVDWSARAKQLRDEHVTATGAEQPNQKPEGPRMKQ